ncbi:MAG: dynamin family protein [Scytonema sp. PMC 1070.18]|nr:dynamin family protein [Scytonema sp. PMC 1070.18]
MILDKNLQELTQQQIDILRDLALLDIENHLQEGLARLLDPNFRLLVVGEYSRGKTTFLNALMGQEILKAAAVPVPITNRLRYGETPSAEVYTDGKVQSVAVADLQEGEFERVELSYPLDLLRDRIELIEHPSMSEKPDAFARALANADLVIVMLACDALYSATETQMIEQIKLLGHLELFFACNFFDRIPLNQQEQVKRAAYVRLPANAERIFFLSCESTLNGNIEAFQVMNALCDRLLEFIATNRLCVKQERLQRLLLQSVDVANKQIEKWQAENSQNQVAAKAKVQQLHESYQEVASAVRMIEGDLEDFRQRTRDVVQTMCRTFIRNLALQIEDWVRTSSTPNLHEFLRVQVGEAVQKWKLKELNPYLREQMIRQEKTLENALIKFINHLDNLYALFSDSFVSGLKIPVNKLSVEDIIINIPGQEVSENVDKVNLVKIPEFMLALVVPIIVVAIIPSIQVALPLAAMGVGAGVYLGITRTQSINSAESEKIAKSYSQLINAQADQITLAVWEKVDTQLENLQTQVKDLLTAQLKQAEHLTNSELEHLRMETSSRFDNFQTRLDTIKTAIS